MGDAVPPLPSTPTATHLPIHPPTYLPTHITTTHPPTTDVHYNATAAPHSPHPPPACEPFAPLPPPPTTGQTKWQLPPSTPLSDDACANTKSQTEMAFRRRRPEIAGNTYHRSRKDQLADNWPLPEDRARAAAAAECDLGAHKSRVAARRTGSGMHTWREERE